MQARVLVAIADGSEELEAITVIDLLRRAGFAVTVASVEADNRLEVTAAHGSRLVADTNIEQLLADTFDLIVLPGGMPGAERLRDNATLALKLRQQRNHQRWIAAICASPAVILGPLGLLDGVSKVTCYPYFHPQLPAAALLANEAVVIDDNCQLVTSQGPATAMAFSLALIEQFAGAACADKVRQQLLLEP